MLENKVVIVTGSGRGLGRAYAVGMARAGAAVVVNDLDEDAALETVRIIHDAGGKAESVVAAVGDSAVADTLVKTAVNTFGRLDVMCTNAGVLRDRTLHKMSDDDFDIVVRSHLRGTFTCGRAAVQHFREAGAGGRLILIGSPAGMRGGLGQTSYSAVKAGITGFVRTWATECERLGVTVNAVIPVALTRMVATIPGMAEAVAAAERGEQIAPQLRRRGFGSPDDVASLVVYLSSDAASHITGQCIGAGGDRLTLWSHPSEVATSFREGGWSAIQIAECFDEIFGAKLQPFRRPQRSAVTAELEGA